MEEYRKIKDTFVISSEGIIIGTKDRSSEESEDKLFKGKPLHIPYFFKRMKKELSKWVRNLPLDNTIITCNEHLKQILIGFISNNEFIFNYIHPIESSNPLIIDMKISKEELFQFPNLIGDSITIKLIKSYWNFYVCREQQLYDETEWFLACETPIPKSHGDIIRLNHGRPLSKYLNKKINYQQNLAKKELHNDII